MAQTRFVGFLASEDLAAQLDQLPNKSAFIRAAILRQLGCPCPLCEGRGTVGIGFGRHYADVITTDRATAAEQT